VLYCNYNSWYSSQPSVDCAVSSTVVRDVKNLTEGSETSAYKIQTPGIHPKGRIQHSEHGESLKSRTVDTYGGIFICLILLCLLSDLVTGSSFFKYAIGGIPKFQNLNYVFPHVTSKNGRNLLCKVWHSWIFIINFPVSNIGLNAAYTESGRPRLSSVTLEQVEQV
jgi:hypothetical protein